MTSTSRVPRAEMTGLYAGALKVVMRRMLGGVPASVEVSGTSRRSSGTERR